MDERTFDRLARLLGKARDRRTGLKALVGGILGAGGMAALDMDAEARRTGNGRKDDAPHAGKKKKKKCDPPCAAGFTCVKGRCTCAGVSCAGACCASGQVCRDGACVEPRPACLPFGEECKNTGRACCDGLTCASGQGGSFPVTCLKAKGATCASSEECPFGTTCTDGKCLGGGGGVPTGAACANGETCAQAGATCTAYTTPGAPAGDYCTLPLRKVCTGDPDCSCYKCWYVNGGPQGAGRAGRASSSTKGCCHTSSLSCVTENDCCNGLSCNGGVCGGTMCVPAGGACADGTCCDGLTCQGGACSGGGGGSKQVGDACTGGDTCPTGSTCTLSSDPAKSAEGTKCLLNDGENTTVAADCKGNGKYDGKCVTCSVYYTAGDNAASFTALETKLKAAAANPSDATKNPVYVGAGTYTFSNPDQYEKALLLETTSTTTEVRILACGNGPVTFDGGATVTIANTTTVPTGGEWSNCTQGVLSLSYTSPAGSADAKGYVIDGIDIQHGCITSTTGSFAGAIAHFAPLTLSNSKITRCKGPAGGILGSTSSSQTSSASLKNVEIRQCYGNDTAAEGAGALKGQYFVTLENATVVYNGTAATTPSTATGGVSVTLNTTGPAGQNLTLKGTVEIKNNANQGLRQSGNRTGNTVFCTDVTSGAGSICGNPTSTATGASNCNGSGTFVGCDNVCKGTPKDTTANGGVC